MLLDRERYPGTHHGQRDRIRPVGLGDQVVQRLMSRLDPAGLDPDRHRLDALALARQQQASAVAPNRGDAVSMPERGTNRFDMG